MKVPSPPEGYIASDQIAAGPAGDMATPHGSFTLQLADGQHQQHDGFDQSASMAYNEESGNLTSEQLAAAYAASQAGFDPQTSFGPGTLGHHQIHPGKPQVAGLTFGPWLARGCPQTHKMTVPELAAIAYIDFSTGHFGQDQLSTDSFETAGGAGMQPEEHAALYAQHQPLQFGNAHDQAQQQQAVEEQHHPVYDPPTEPAEREAPALVRPQPQGLET